MHKPGRSPRQSGHNSKLVKVIERFLQRHGMSPTRLGREACGDVNLVRQLRQGRELRAATLLRVQRYMRLIEGPPARRKRSKARAVKPLPTASPAAPPPDEIIALHK